MTRKRVDGTEVFKGVHDEFRPIHREDFVDRDVSRDFGEQAWYFF